MQIRFESNKVSLTAESQAEDIQLQQIFEYSNMVELGRSESGRAHVSFYLDDE